MLLVYPFVKVFKSVKEGAEFHEKNRQEKNGKRTFFFCSTNVFCLSPKPRIVATSSCFCSILVFLRSFLAWIYRPRHELIYKRKVKKKLFTRSWFELWGRRGHRKQVQTNERENNQTLLRLSFRCFLAGSLLKWHSSSHSTPVIESATLSNWC